MRNFAKFYPNTQKSENFVLMGNFSPKYFSYKNTDELSFMTLNSDTTFQLKNSIGIMYYETEE